MSQGISITELRQRLFQLADHVAATGEPLVIERRGVCLRLVRDDAAPQAGGRLARLTPRRQSVVVGPPLDPHESPAQWVPAWPKVAEPGAAYGKARGSRAAPRKPRQRP